MHPSIAQRIAGISAICRRHGVRRLDVFGSAARGTDFYPGQSDIDFLIEFDPEAPVGLHRFFGVKAELEQLLGRNVDLVEPDAIRNPYVLANINRNRQRVYDA